MSLGCCCVAAATAIVYCAPVTLTFVVVTSASDGATMAIITSIVFISISSTHGKEAANI
jgi:hypothetical protein